MTRYRHIASLMIGLGQKVPGEMTYPPNVTPMTREQCIKNDWPFYLDGKICCTDYADGKYVCQPVSNPSEPTPRQQPSASVFPSLPGTPGVQYPGAYPGAPYGQTPYGQNPYGTYPSQGMNVTTAAMIAAGIVGAALLFKNLQKPSA